MTAASPKAQRRYGIAQLGPAQAFDLAGAGHGAFDQPAVGEEVLHGGEARDVADLAEDGQAQVFADAGHGLEQGILAGGDLFGLALEFLFELEDLVVEVADHGQVVLAGRAGAGDDPRRPGVAAPTDRGCGGFVGSADAVVGQLMGVDAGQQFGAAPDVEEALAQERAQRAFVGGIDVGRRDEIGAQQVGDLFGVDAVVLVLAAVDGLEVEGVGQDEGEAGGLAGIGQPVPAEHAFAADGQVVAIGRDELEEVSRSRCF